MHKVIASSLALFILVFLSEIKCFAMPAEKPVERQNLIYEVNMLAAPDPKEVQLKDVLFNADLSREIRSRYVDKFGSVDTEALIYRNTRYAEMPDKAPDQSTFDSTRNERKQFGEFILKRLLEWHVDEKMKSTPELKKAYEVKQALSEMSVPVSKDSKLEVRISIVGDSVDILYLNPYFNTRYAIDPVKGENKLIFSQALDKKTILQTDIHEKDGIASIELQKLISINTTASLKESSWFSPTGTSPRETKTSILFGRTF